MLCTFKLNHLVTDDVFQHQFLSAIVFCSSNVGLELEPDAQAVLEAWGTQWFHIITPGPSSVLGPHLLCDGKLVPVSRLYNDVANAFVAPYEFDIDNGFCDAVSRSNIAVRSRAATFETGTKPLENMRMTVKDMFDVEGHCTGLGSRAYRELARRAAKTAPAIQRLIDLGADLIGMTKLCAMVGTTDPTQTVDYEAPWNPRADGFQSPSGGSSGQPSAIAAYDWLDFAVGSDATVSGRLPAQANGVFSLRPSVGAVSTEGMWSAVAAFDTPCLFARDIDIIRKIMKLWQNHPLKEHQSKGSPIIYIPTDFLPVQNQHQMHVFDSFIDDVCKYLPGKVERISIDDLWKRRPPAEAEHQELKEYLSPTVAIRSYVYDFWRKVLPFIEAYCEKFHRQPFFPPPKGRDLWEDAKGVTSAQNREAWAKVSVYKGWLHQTIFGDEDQDAIVVAPLACVSPCYRDEWPAPPLGGQQMWEPLLMAPILGAPEVVVPAGEMKYHSRISERDEFLPVCVSIMGRPGTDQNLLDLIHRILERSGRQKKVNTGRRMF